jgi:hypothetical protein
VFGARRHAGGYLKRTARRIGLKLSGRP